MIHNVLSRPDVNSMKLYKPIISVLFLLVMTSGLRAQELQLMYDFRHTADPEHNDRNFPWLDFKIFKEIDTLHTGSFLFEAQSFLNGTQSNMGQTFIQVSQTLKFWKPSLYLNFYFSGGLGVTPDAFGFYIPNAYSTGISTLLPFEKVWINLSLLYRYSAYPEPGHDPQVNIYVGGGLFQYRLMYSSTLVMWTNDRDAGTAGADGEKGKKLLFFADPQAWYSLGKGFSMGTRLSLSYNITENNHLSAYPALGIKRSF